MPTHPSSLIASPGPRPRRCRRPSINSDDGFTLIEVLVSALIVILIASAAAVALVATSHFSGDQRFRSQADALAAQDQERLRGLSDEQLNNFSQSRQETVNGVTFAVASSATFVDSTGATGCTSGAAAYYKITSTVSWTENFGNATPVTEESILSRPVTGDLLTQVKDQTGQGLAGVTVTATGPGVQTSTTGTNGCILFAGLTPGLYTVSMADAGYVDPNGVSAPLSSTATVSTSSPASTTGNPFYLGLPGSITGTFTTAVAGAAGEADSISWLGSGSSLGMSGGFRSHTMSGPLPGISTLNLFPFNGNTTGYSNNYAVWAGRCLQQEPPSGYDHYTVNPGSLNQAQSIQEPDLDLAVNYYNGSTTAAVKPAHVKLAFQSTAGTNCGYSWSPSIASGATTPATGWLTNPGQPFASTATTGANASGASTTSSAQAGTLTACVDYKPGTTSYFNAVPVSNTNFSSTQSSTTILITKSTATTGVC
jgi:type II secretory pathway pseudopilin PulG